MGQAFAVGQREQPVCPMFQPNQRKEDIHYKAISSSCIHHTKCLHSRNPGSTQSSTEHWTETRLSLVPSLLPDFIAQPWRKIIRRPWNQTTSRTGNGGLGQYITWTRFVLTEFTISAPWRNFDPRPSPGFSPQLKDKMWEGPGDEASLDLHYRIICYKLRVRVSWITIKMCGERQVQFVIEMMSNFLLLLLYRRLSLSVNSIRAYFWVSNEDQISQKLW